MIKNVSLLRQWPVEEKMFRFHFRKIRSFFLRLEFFKRSQQEIHIHLERISIESIPKENNEEISMWLFERFEKKDT